MTDDRDALRRERDFYLRILQLGEREDIEAFLDASLALVMEASGATKGFLELHERDKGGRWWLACGFTTEDIDAIRAETSRGIIGEALATGRTVQTASAASDPRFSDRTSVQRNDVAGVLCAAVGTPPMGVVYLQGEAGLAPFTPQVRRMAEVFAVHLAPHATHLITRQRDATQADPTRPFRDRLRLDTMVGRSRALADVFEQVSLVAPLDVHVLITGPSGTGKTTLARMIALNGPRASASFVELSCAAIPDNLLESELFGAVRGAHSTATQDIEGKIAAAENGTLFLDEIAELSLASQAKLLKLIQTKVYFPLGSNSPRTANVRIIAATNVDLKQRVAEKLFREDLMYRLQVLPIAMPSLGSRRDDVPLLADRFCRQACDELGIGPLRLSIAARRAVHVAEWGGNVRELRHAVQAGVIRAHGAQAAEVEASHLFPNRAVEEADETLADATRAFQRQVVVGTLDETDWNVSAAAKRLGIARSHLYNLLDSFGLRRPKN